MKCSQVRNNITVRKKKISAWSAAHSYFSLTFSWQNMEESQNEIASSCYVSASIWDNTCSASDTEASKICYETEGSFNARVGNSISAGDHRGV